MNNIRLVIAVPCSHPYMHTRWVIQFLNKYNKLQKEFMEYGTQDDYVMPAIHNHPNLPTNRNELVRKALDKEGINATHILFLDSDILMPDNGIEIMLKRDLNIHGLLCFTRNFYNPKPIIYKNNEIIDPVPEGVIEVDSTGCGCLMIKRDVFIRIADLPEFQQNGGNFFTYKESWFGNQSKKLSEDRFFCMLAKKAGFDILVDTVNSCQHLTIQGVGMNEYINSIKRTPSDQSNQKMLPLSMPKM